MSGPKLSPVPYWLWPGYKKTDADRLQAASATHLRKDSESGTPSRRRDLRRRLESKYVHSVSESHEPRRSRSESPRKRGHERKTVFKRLEKCVFLKLGDKEKTAKTKRWAMPTWCQMFNSTLTKNVRVWFDDISQESIDSYDDLKKAFLENYLQQKKCIKDSIEIHNIKQRDGESTEEFVRRYKLECKDVKRAMRLPEPTKVGAKAGQKKKNESKLCEFHREVGHTTDECVHLKRKIEETLKAGQLSRLIKELKQSNRKNHAKAAKKRETSRKDKPLAILMVQPWQRVAKQRITQTFSPETVISFSPLGEEDVTEGPMITDGGTFRPPHVCGRRLLFINPIRNLILFKARDPLSPFLFILVMESLLLSFNNVVQAGLFKGIHINDSLNLSHLFYADDVIFIGEWNLSNISTIVNVLKWFHLASGLKINLHKSKLMSIGIPQDVVASSARNFFNGVDIAEKKMSLISWKKVLASKKNCGLGVSCFFAMNRSLLFKWVKREVKMLSSNGIDLLSLIVKKVGNARRIERVVAKTVVVPRRHRKKLIRSFFAAMINDGKQTEQDDERGEAHQNWVAEVGRSEAIGAIIKPDSSYITIKPQAA
nr:RNA-directed DNA polymerase, eukaryota [Tanacetum cinerariifolium]